MEVDGPQFAAVVPVAALNGERRQYEVVGSGVVAQIAGNGLLLSAAHLLDTLDVGTLIIPGPETFGPVAGATFCSDAPGGDRNEDQVDVGYVRLGAASELRLDPRAMLLIEEDLATEVHADDGPIAYTFVGFPWRRSKSRGGDIYSEQLRISGTGLNGEELKQHGLDPEVNIAIKFDRRTSTYSGKRAIAPRLDGMSGGGIFVGPRPHHVLPPVPSNFRLAGITHTYLAKQSLLVGTRIEGLVGAIWNNALTGGHGRA